MKVGEVLSYATLAELKQTRDGKTFTDFTLSPKHNSKKDVKQWIQYAKCMINGYSIRKALFLQCHVKP